ncbi:MAG: ATP-binding protein [Clostridiales bacterium]|nr:ATP-binding protein [Clostridiales bacterium]
MASLSELFSPSKREVPFESYREYTDYLFACVDMRLSDYIDGLMGLFASQSGGYKNVIYPDVEIARDLCDKQLAEFLLKSGGETEDESGFARPQERAVPPTELDELFAEFAEDVSSRDAGEGLSATDCMEHIKDRAKKAQGNIFMPMYELCEKLGLSPFSTFCFACAVLSATQTSYAGVFQVVNQNGALSAPTIESAARVFYGKDFSITEAYSEMSLALEQLTPVFALSINNAMPFSTVVSPDKRMIDFLFGPEPNRIDENYARFFSRLTDKKEIDPFIANRGILDAVNIFYDDGGRIVALWGDEGAGRKFTITHFCRDREKGCVSINCTKLFVYDFAFVDKALWAAARECILTDSCVCLDGLAYREEEKEKFFGYMDLAFGKFTKYDIPAFAVSMEKLPMRQISDMDFAQIEIPTPDTREREQVWDHYAQGYSFADDVDLTEMAAKFLFTSGKIKSAIHQAKTLAAMDKKTDIPRSILFQSCNNQMSHELTQKATRIPAKFGWNDIVMNPDQRLALKNACDQLIYRKKVYEEWDYLKKYQYGRGLSVLLFGAPGTGKSMCAQVIANELNLELYRVDLSKVVDKYVGETEKSISMIFREAKKCNVVLFFDECDTLFAKRSDDGGSNQSSNNNKTALLLQEVEAYDGVSVMATNYKHNIDPAFFRRMKFIVEFQFPDVETRKILWNATIPKNTPLAEDVDIDFLAQRFEFVGGNIKNCILNAAFLAAADPEAEGQVHMKHYLQAIRYEFVKTGKVFTRADFEPYAHLVL